MGATHTINYKDTPEWEKEVLRLTGGKGVDHVLDTVGVSDIERCLGCVAPGGVISSVGVLGGEAKGTPNIPLLAIFKQAIIRYALLLLSHRTVLDAETVTWW